MSTMCLSVFMGVQICTIPHLHDKQRWLQDRGLFRVKNFFKYLPKCMFINHSLFNADLLHSRQGDHFIEIHVFFRAVVSGAPREE